MCLFFLCFYLLSSKLYMDQLPLAIGFLNFSCVGNLFLRCQLQDIFENSCHYVNPRPCELVLVCKRFMKV